MNFNNFTIKTQEAIQKAVEITRGAGTQAVEPVCLLKGVMEEGESVVKFIFQKIGASPATIASNTDREISLLPKVSGQEPYLSRSNDVLQKSLDIAKKQGDQYVTLEAMLMALFEVSSPASSILKDAGLGAKELKAAVDELRKGKKATDQGAEETYNALSKYAVNLNERATKKSAGCFRFCRVAPRTTPCSSASLAPAKPPLPKVLRTASSVAMFPKTCAPNRFFRSTWARWWLVQNTKASLKNALKRL